MRPRSSRLRSALLAIVTATTVALPLAATPAYADTDCSTATDDGPTWYDGNSASYRYDAKFGGGPGAVPQSVLDAYVPQGLGTWRNWDGTGADLLVYTAYHEDENGRRSVVQGINPQTGNRTNIAYVPAGHVGGIAFGGGHAWISGGGTVDRYSLTALRGAFKGTTSASINPGAVINVSYSSFLSEQGGDLFAGEWNPDGRGKMHRYRIRDNGTLEFLSVIEVPKKAQGLAVTDDHYFFSTSQGERNRSNIYVVRRGSSLDSSGTSCFRAPTMSEGATIYNGQLFVLYESGAHKYTSYLNPTNVITRLHKAPLGELTSLVG